jgi:hypothetical protein
VEGVGTVARIDQVADTIYWIGVFTPEKRLGFNQFVIDDERPALVHTGQRARQSSSLQSNARPLLVITPDPG